MKISIIMPSYNQGRYIEAAIRSVLDQSYPDKELIVIDGGSTDETVSTLRRYEGQLKYWVSEPDRGQAHALNKALGHVTGDVVGWLNSDDLYLPNAFRRAMRALNANPCLSLVHGDRVLIDQRGHLTGWSRGLVFDPLSTGYAIASETAFWRVAKDGSVPQFREDFHFCMDSEYFLRLIRTGSFKKINAYMGAFRCYPDNKSSTMLDICHAEGLRLVEEFPDAVCVLRYDPPRVKWRSLLDLIVSPRTLGIPYVIGKTVNRG